MVALMLVAQSAQLRSKLSKKSATRETSKMARRLPTGSSEVQLMPRRRAFAEGGGGDKQWSQATDAATAAAPDAAATLDACQHRQCVELLGRRMAVADGQGFVPISDL